MAPLESYNTKKKFWEEVITYFPFTTYGISDIKQAAYKALFPKVLLLCVHSLTQEHVNQDCFYWLHYSGFQALRQGGST
jgi:hypothetical protein